MISEAIEVGLLVSAPISRPLLARIELPGGRSGSGGPFLNSKVGGTSSGSGRRDTFGPVQIKYGFATRGREALFINAVLVVGADPGRSRKSRQDSFPHLALRTGAVRGCDAIPRADGIDPGPEGGPPRAHRRDDRAHAGSARRRDHPADPPPTTHPWDPDTAPGPVHRGDANQRLGKENRSSQTGKS